MTENGDPLENAIAERINGIIKGEYLFDYNIENLNHARTVLKAVVNLYNNDRPHASLNNALPTEIHENQIASDVKRLWKNYYNKDAKPSLENEMCKPILG